MFDAVIMPPEATVIFLGKENGEDFPWEENPERIPADWEIRRGVTLDPIPDDLHKWPFGAERPDAVLCVAAGDERHFRVYKYRSQIDRSQFLDTGLLFGGCFIASASFWDRLVKQHEASMASALTPDDDPPGTMDEILERLQQER